MIAVSKESTKDQKADVLRLLEKESALTEFVSGFSKVVIAYSGGVDSSYLSYIANRELGENSISMLGVSPSVSTHQREIAENFALQQGLRLIRVNTSETADSNYIKNDSNRCYYCKTDLYLKAVEFAKLHSAEVVFDGTNFDDLSDIRHGIKAANEVGVRSPLADLRFSKQDIRDLSRHHGLPIWDLPSSPCLSSRIAHGTPVTIGRLSKIERAEHVLRQRGFGEFRVRAHEEMARIEIAPLELNRILKREMFDEICVEIEKIGFKFVTLDMKGFRSGSLN